MAYSRERDSFLRNHSSFPGRRAVLITPADSELAEYCKALRVINEGAGVATVRVTMIDEPSDLIGAAVDLKFPVGLTYEPASVRRVWTTGTSGTITIHGFVS